MYEVSYRESDWADKIYVVRVVAANVIRAAQSVGMRKYIRSSGRVTRVDEIFQNVQIAK